MSIFAGIKQGERIELYALTHAYEEDTFEKKVNLGVGVYRTEKGEPWVLPVVRHVEKVLSADDTLTKEYLPSLGLEKFCEMSIKILLGNESPAILENRVFSIQTLSGTGSLRVLAAFLANQVHYSTYYVSVPTWSNYDLIFKPAGFKERRTYRYWNHDMKGLDIEGMLEDLKYAPEHSIIILHSSAHNPTGCDPTREQWERIVDIIEAKKLLPVIDCAYQGLASGDLDEDAWSLRFFVSRGLEFFCCQCYSKNLGLYNERIGNLMCVVKDPEVITNVKSKLALIVSGLYSTPPSHGARIVTHILTNPSLFEEWKECLKRMASKMIEIRRHLREALEKLETPGKWNHITDQVGMFSYTGLNERQSLHMIHNYHIYMMRTGRINVCGLNEDNIDYVARAIYDTVTNILD